MHSLTALTLLPFFLRLRRQLFWGIPSQSVSPVVSRTKKWSYLPYWDSSDIVTMRHYIWIFVSTGLGGSPTNTGQNPGPGQFDMVPQHLTQCPPGTCFRQNMCIRTESGGFQCAPCPDGYTGDGVHCDDVDEVWIVFPFYERLFLKPGGESSVSRASVLFVNVFSASSTHVSLVSAVWTLLLAFAVRNALWDTLGRSWMEWEYPTLNRTNR